MKGCSKDTDGDGNCANHRISCFDEMPAGREMDAFVAEKVMGYAKDTPGQLQVWPYFSLGTFYDKPVVLIWTMTAKGSVNNPDVFAPSTDIATAFEVVEKLRSKGKDLDLTYRAVRRYANYVTVFFYGCTSPTEADTVPLAICRAALKAVSR